MRNAAQRKSIRVAEKQAAVDERSRIEFICAAMDTLQGRAWFHEFLVTCHIFSDPFTGDALIEAYSKGERNVGLRVYNDIVTNCPDQFVMMMKEANIKEQVNDRRDDDNAGDDDGDYDADGTNDRATGELAGREDIYR